jgi:hypothetical protein
MHCLPAHRGHVAAVIDGRSSIVWEQAASRFPAERATLGCSSAALIDPVNELDCAEEPRTMHVHTPFIDPPDVAGAIGRLIHPGRPRAVVRFTAEMLGPISWRHTSGAISTGGPHATDGPPRASRRRTPGHAPLSIPVSDPEEVRMSPRLLSLLDARNAPIRRRERRPPRGLSDRDWMDAQAEAAPMPGRWRVAHVMTREHCADLVA